MQKAVAEKVVEAKDFYTKRTGPKKHFTRGLVFFFAALSLSFSLLHCCFRALTVAFTQQKFRDHMRNVIFLQGS